MVKVEDSFPQSGYTFAQHILPTSRFDGNASSEGSLQHRLSSTILQARAEMRGNKNDFDSDKLILSEQRVKAGSTSMPICMPDHNGDRNAIGFDGREKFHEKHLVDLSDCKEVEVGPALHGSSKVFQKYDGSVRRKFINSRTHECGTNY